MYLLYAYLLKYNMWMLYMCQICNDILYLHISKMATSNEGDIYSFGTKNDINLFSMSNSTNIGMENSFLAVLIGYIVPQCWNWHNLHISKMAATDESDIYNFWTKDARKGIKLD